MSGQLDRFVPEQLSPVPVQMWQSALPYGLTWDDLRPGLPGFEGADGASAWVSHALRGLHKKASSCILTLRYRATDGSTRTHPVFFKVADSAEADAEKNRFLCSQGVPTVRLLHVASRDGGVVLLFEFLPTIGIEPAEADDLLGLMARLNAVGHPPVSLFRPGPGVPDFDARVEASLTRLANDPTALVPIDPQNWFEAYQRAAEIIATMPVALNHGELYFQQIGWSVGDGERRLVIFDLETVALLPRFTDIADVLHGLSSLTGRDQRELFAVYLHMLRKLTGIEVDEACAWRDMRLVRVVRSFQSLPWLIEMAGHPDVGQTPVETALTLHDDLEALKLLRGCRRRWGGDRT